MPPRPQPARPVSKHDYKAQVLLLREELLAVQQRLRHATFPVIVLFSGVDGAGKGETVNLLHEWMDPRWIHTHAYTEPSDEERERPEHWRFWRDLPPKGQIGILMNAWYAGPIDQHAHRVIETADFRRQLQRIARFERLLTDDGALILKFLMHLDRDTQRARLKALERDPLTRWRVTDEQWRQARSYDELVEAEAMAVRLTDASQASWSLVDGSDERHRSLVVARTMRGRIAKRLDEQARGRVARGRTARVLMVHRPPPDSKELGGRHQSCVGDLAVDALDDINQADTVNYRLDAGLNTHPEVVLCDYELDRLHPSSLAHTPTSQQE